MSADTFLSRLDRVKRTGPGRYQARCPAHDDRGPSLSVRELDDGRVLVHCFAGCSVHEVVSAAGLALGDLFPEKVVEHGRPERKPFPAGDVLRAIAFEALIVATAGAALLAGQAFSGIDRDRLMLAVARIQSAITVLGVDHG